MRKLFAVLTMIALLSGLTAQAQLVFSENFNGQTITKTDTGPVVFGGASPEVAVEQWFSAANGIAINDELQLTNFSTSKSRGAGIWLDSSAWGNGPVTVTFDVLDYAAGGPDSESFFQAYYASGVVGTNSVSIDLHGAGGLDPVTAAIGSALIGTIGARNTITANATQVEFTFDFTGQDNIALVFHNKSAATATDMPVYSVDNLTVNTPIPVTVWELDMNTDPVLTNWVVRNASTTNYTLSGGVMTMNDSTQLDSNPVNSLKGVTQVDLEWRSITEGTGSKGRGAYLWLNIDGDAPDKYSVRFESILTNDTQTVQFVNGDAVAHTGFSTNMLTLSATLNAFNETAEYIVTDGTLSVTNSVNLVASTPAANQAATLGTQGPSAEVDYVRVEANVRPDEAHLVASDAIAIDLEGPATTATGSVDLEYGTVSDDLEITDITVSDESHGVGSFNVVTVSPATLDSTAYGTSELEVEFDNGVAGLSYGSATGLVTVTWTETGSGVMNDTVVPVSANYTPTPNLANIWNGAGNGVNWGDADNWNQDRVPGVYTADRGIIANGDTVTVATNFTGSYTYEVTVRGGSTLDITADLKNVDDLNVATAIDHDGTINQTAGDVTSASLDISVANNSSNAVYTLSGGTLTTSGDGSIQTNGQMVINGGTLIYDMLPEMVVGGVGLLTLESGTWSSTGTGANDLDFYPDVEISGGTVDLNGRNRFYGGEFKIIGDAAAISIDSFNITPNFVFEFAPGGGSALSAPVCSYLKLLAGTILVDGSNYNGGSAEIPLFSTPNITGVPADPATALVTTNFADGITATISVDQDTDTVILTITVVGFDSWIGGFGLSGDDLLPGADVEPDGLNNLMEYALGGNPTNDDAAVVSPKTYTADDGGTDYFYHVSDQRTDDDSLTFSLGATDNLVFTAPDTSDVSFVGESATANNYKTVTNRTEATPNAKFIQLEVQKD